VIWNFLLHRRFNCQLKFSGCLDHLQFTNVSRRSDFLGLMKIMGHYKLTIFCVVLFRIGFEIGSQKYFHKRPIGPFWGSVGLSLINTKMLRVNFVNINDGLWVTLLFMWVFICNRPHVVDNHAISTTWGLLKMEIHIKRSLTHKPSIDKIWTSRRQPFIRSIFEFINERSMEPRNEPMGLLWKYFWPPNGKK